MASVYHADESPSPQVDEGELIECQLADVPFEDIQRLRSMGQGTAPPIRRGRSSSNTKAEGPRRENKNRPMEVSSKKPVPRFREIIQTAQKVSRDPRFEPLCGDYEESRFKNSYGFLYSQNLPQEAEKLKKALKKEKSNERRTELQSRLSTISAQVKEETRRKQREEKEAARKEQQKESVQSGQQPYFLSKSKRKREELVEKFKELKAQGKLESFLAKKRKKNASKEHKSIPTQRRS